ncbi:metallophosphoesterase MPPED2 isoform X2 [Cervus elaphus]|uniref:metallophosphoesterase MPPED2 isoform X2 n=1 Tax=Cervus elaphus TaxID=9860 RepID=UPI001CC2721D|nr:metallophosphoesterase MPPED2 isoform X2 [Cervus elaphus]
MAHGIPSQGKVTITVDEYSSNPTQAFTHYNINQSRFQPPHVHMVDPIPYDTPKPAGHTRFVCISDTHSRTDGIQMPYGDILLHTGDFTELGLPSEVKKFNDWLGNLPYEYKIVIAGNHELTFDKEFMADLVKQDYYRFPSVSKLKPEDFDNVQSLLTNSIYLQDSEVTVKGFRIYGAPCSRESTGSCLLDTSAMQMPFRCCLGPSLGRAKPVLQRPSLGLLAALETLGSRRAPAPMSQVAKLRREETASFAWFYPCTMKCAILKSQSKL